ncbi:MAG: hypothetical protein ACI86H_000026 [bacterium]|jgi:hypothetical protein
MHHYFDLLIETTSEDLEHIRKIAHAQLKKTPLKVMDMKTPMTIFCVNGNLISDYIPAEYNRLVSLKIIHPVGDSITTSDIQNFQEKFQTSTQEILGLVLTNIQVKNIKNYFDIAFNFNHKNTTYIPKIVTHLSKKDLLSYLQDFLSEDSGTKRFIEVYTKQNLKDVWRTFNTPEELAEIQTQQPKPIVLDKPFFSEIQLIVPQTDGTKKVLPFAFGSLNKVLGQFNTPKQITQNASKSVNTLYLSVKDVVSLKIASVQDPKILGISIKGEVIHPSKFISKNIGIDFNSITDIDFIRIKTQNGPKEIIFKNNPFFDVNLHTQQIIFDSSINHEDSHIQNFHQIKLYKGEESATIDQAIPIESGEEAIKHAFMFSYQLAEMMNKVKLTTIESIILKKKFVVAGDLMSELVLSNLKLLGQYQFPIYTVGYDSKDINNPDQLYQKRKEIFDTVYNYFESIVNVSDVPYFKKESFDLRVKYTLNFLNNKDTDKVSLEDLIKIETELESLIKYMDDFFKLDIYQKWNDELDVENAEEIPEEDSTELENSDLHLDNETKDFIGENFQFFYKRKLVLKALVIIRNMIFYQKNIASTIQIPSFEPDVIVFSNEKDTQTHYDETSYPAFSIKSLLKSNIFKGDELENQFFIQFIRGFTQKVLESMQKQDTSFYHQYKHTLAEVGFVLDEKLQKLKEQVAFLDNPQNKESVYKKLLDDITKMYQEHLQSKEEDIQKLQIEYDKVLHIFNEYLERFEDLLGEKIPPEGLDEVMETTLEKVEHLKFPILELNGIKKKSILPVYNSLGQLRKSANAYYTKVLNYSSQYLKAQFAQAEIQMLSTISAEIRTMLKWDEEQLQQKQEELNSTTINTQNKSKLQKEIISVQEDLKDSIIRWRKLSYRELFQEKGKDKGDLQEYIQFFLDQIEQLQESIREHQIIYFKFGNLETKLFKKQSEIADIDIQVRKQQLLKNVIQILLINPNEREQIKEQLRKTEAIPKEIKEELFQLRGMMNDNLQVFKKETMQENIDQISDYEEILSKVKYRSDLHETYKQLLNYKIGVVSLTAEIKAEEEDLEFLKSQEDHLETITMSKTLPSTRALLKNQYIPDVERELRLLKRANLFYTEISGLEKNLSKKIQNTFFRKRYKYPQFIYGSYCMDDIKAAQSHTEKNVNSAFVLLSEKYVNACAPAVVTNRKVQFSRATVHGLQGVKDRVKEIWLGNLNDRFVYLPATFSFQDALTACRYKDTLIKNQFRPNQSHNSIILIYIGEINYQEIENDPHMMEQYHQVILSNVFINIDNKSVFNNRDSIIDGCVKQTFGNADDLISREIIHQFYS